MTATLAFISTVLALVPALAQAGISVANLISGARDALTEVGAPTNAQWQALDAQCSSLETQFAADLAASQASTTG